jgi:Mg-chelatase subunit ChlD
LERPETSDDALDATLDAAQDALDRDAKDADLPADSSIPVACIPGQFTLAPAIPSVLFVADRSGSMATAFSGGKSRWAVLRDAFRTTLPAIDQTVALGALIFPVENAGNQNCSSPASPDILPAIGQVPSFLTLMSTTAPSGSTPTAVALATATQALASVRAASTARAIVLADGAPGCNAALNPTTCVCVALGNGRCNDANRCLDDVRTVATIERSLKAGIPTYVIGLASGDVAYEATLDAMAVAGGRPKVGATRRYYSANSEAELEGALVTIREQVAGCTFLSTSVPADERAISVMLGGVEVPYDATGQNGWYWADRANGEMVLRGGACTAAVAAGAGPLVVEVGCPESDGGLAAD